MKARFLLQLAAFLAAAATGCDTQEALDLDRSIPFSSHDGFGSMFASLRSSAPLTLLPQDKGDESPACLDGSPYGFYFNKAKTVQGATKWTISIEGGGWCYDEDLCLDRASTNLGSSKHWAKEAGCGCMNADENGPVEDCNCLYMPYGDGASFSGYRSKPWPVPNQPGKTLTFRGIKNLDATLEWAFANAGLGNATEFVLTGGSAGGLSTFLHADRVAERVRAGAPRVEKIVAAPVVGYFRDADNYKHTTGVPDTPTWKQANYTDWMHYIYTMQNLTFSRRGERAASALATECLEKHRSHPWYCFMSPHMVDVIETPVFVFNSRFDAWQLANEFQSDWETKDEQAGVIAYGAAFEKDFRAVSSHEKNGAFITSCICHGCPWSDASALSIEGVSPWKAYGEWYTGKARGSHAVHVDTRNPNGGGAITHPACAKFP